MNDFLKNYPDSFTEEDVDVFVKLVSVKMGFSGFSSSLVMDHVGVPYKMQEAVLSRVPDQELMMIGKLMKDAYNAGCAFQEVKTSFFCARAVKDYLSTTYEEAMKVLKVSPEMKTALRRDWLGNVE